MSLHEVRICLVELPNLPDGPPMEIAVTSIPKIGVRDPLEPPRSVKPRGDFIGDRLIVDKAAITCRANGLFV